MSNRLVTEEFEMQLKELEARKKELKAKRKEEKKKQRQSKGGGGLIVLCIVLTILTIGLSVTLFFSIRQSLMRIDTLEEQCVAYSFELSATPALKEALDTANSTISSLQSEVEKLRNKLAETDPEDVEYSHSFASVYALLSAIQKAPKEYNDKQVKVVGSFYNDDDVVALFDWESTDDYAIAESNRSAKKVRWKSDKFESKEMVDIVFLVDVPSAMLITKNYIKLYGTIRIDNGKVYIENCDYELIS